MKMIDTREKKRKESKCIKNLRGNEKNNYEKSKNL